MTELERFWHWYDHETPGLRKGAPMLHRNVGERGRIAVNIAIEHVSRATGLRDRDAEWAPLMGVVKHLSLAVEGGLLRMDADLAELGVYPYFVEGDD